MDHEPEDQLDADHPVAPKNGYRSFLHILINTAVANLTTSYLWFALTFWVYLETENVMATGIIGGAFMLLIAIFSMLFGSIVDQHRKKSVFVFSACVTAVMFVLAGAIYLLLPTERILDIGGWEFWLFCMVILLGSIVEQMRGIALSTTVTLLIPVERHANATRTPTVWSARCRAWPSSSPAFSAGCPSDCWAWAGPLRWRSDLWWSAWCTC